MEHVLTQFVLAAVRKSLSDPRTIKLMSQKAFDCCAQILLSPRK